MAKTQPKIDDIKGLTQWINFLCLKLKDLFSDESATTNDNYLPKIDDINKKLVKSNINDDGTTPKYGANKIWHSGNNGSGSGLDSDLLDGKHASDFATSTHNHSTEYLGITEKAADSDKLDGKHASDFATSTHNHNTTYLGISAQASDSAKLGGQLPSYYEPAFNKNNAFNKTFGTGTSDVARGDHGHSDLHSHTNKPALDALTGTNITALNAVTGTNTGDETTARIGTLINSATAKTTPVDADMVGLMDSAASNVLKKLSWSNIKATLEAYFNTLYAKLSFASIKVGTENVNASRESTVEFIAGANVSLTANNTAKTITIAASETIQLLNAGGEILNYLTDGVYRLNLNHLTGNYPDSVCGTKHAVTPTGTEILRQYTGNNGNQDIKTQIMLIGNETYRRSGLGNYWNEWERLITCKDMANYVTVDMLGTFDGEYLEPYNSVDVYRDTTYRIDGDAKEGKYIINLTPLFTDPPLEIIEIYIDIFPESSGGYTLEIKLSDYAIDTLESSSSTAAHFGDNASITIPQGTSFVLLKIYMFVNVSRCRIVYTFG